MGNWKDRLEQFSHRLAYASLISTLTWIFALHLPHGGYPWSASLKAVRLMNFPVAVATQLLPCDEFAIDLWFSGRAGEGCPAQISLKEFFFNHMRLGIPVYVVIFYLPNIYFASRRLLRRTVDNSPT